MKTILTITLIFCLQFGSTLKISAQKNFLNGYVVAINGDTLKGFIDYRNWDKNPTVIKFKPTNESSEIAYTPSNIQKFMVANEVYESASIDIEISPTNLDALSKDSKFRLKKDTAFVQVLLEGVKSLYYLKDQDGKEHFYINKDGGYELLLHKRYLITNNDRNIATSNPTYKNQLNYYLTDCKEIKNEINEVDYNLHSIKELFDNYYKHTNAKIDFNKKNEKSNVAFGLIGGGTITSLKLNRENPDILTMTDFQSATGFSGGVFFDIPFPRNYKKISLNNELVFSSYKTTGTYEISKSANEFASYSSTLQFSYIKLYNMLRYRLSHQNKPNIFLNAGIANGFAISETNEMTSRSQFYKTEIIKESKAIDDLRKYEQSILFGIGAEFKKLSIEARYERGNGFSPYATLKSSTSRTHLLLAYKLR